MNTTATPTAQVEDTSLFARSAAGRAFDQIYGKIEKVAEFNPQWENGTGYLNDIATDDIYARPRAVPGIGLAIGEQAKCIDSHNRKIIITQTPVGPVVVFERYARGKNSIFVFNAAAPLIALGYVQESGVLREGDMINLVGHEDSNCVFGNGNIGCRMRQLFEHAKQFAAGADPHTITASLRALRRVPAEAA